MLNKLKEHIPWQLKVISKIFLSRIPTSYSFWNSISLFRHGDMNSPDYAYAVFTKHFNRVVSSRNRKLPTSFVAMEIGPGDSLFSSQLAKCYGAKRTYLMDAGHFVTYDPSDYNSMHKFLKEKGLSLEEFSAPSSLNMYLSEMDCIYGTKGLESWKEVPDKCVDFLWSHAVIEHIEKDDFLSHLKEMKRVMKSDCISSHRIDLKDHLGGALNNLRFNSNLWESSLFKGAGFYTNRLRYSEIINYMEESGFNVKVINIDRWENLPTPRKKISREFDCFSDDDLCVSGFDVLLIPN